MKCVRIVLGLVFLNLVATQPSMADEESTNKIIAIQQVEIENLKATVAALKSVVDAVISGKKWVGESTNLAGPQGPTGATGATGAAGPRGGTGPKGDKGDRGDQGFRAFDPPINFKLEDHWGTAHRAAHEYCVSQGYAAGFPNGHGQGTKRGVMCVR